MKHLRIYLLLLSVAVSVLAMAQIPVTGVVVDEKGESLPGVNVQIKGQNKGTVTDIDGKFSISVPDASTVLAFSYIGYDRKEQKPVKNQILKVVLIENAKSLEEVVVIGYGDVKKKDNTGVVANVDVSEIQKAPVMSFDQALAGRVAGVNVSSSEGTPGGTMNIVIRGANSITQDNSPLYVIDGFPVEDPAIAATLNTNDIENLTILKDASATAIYGARGANGVVIITTKKGTVGAPKVSYDGSYGVQRAIQKIPMMDAYEFVKLQSEIYTPTEMTGNFGYFQTKDAKTWTLEDYRNIKQHNWQEMILQDAPVQNHGISITGGTPEARYTGSLSYFDQDGVVTKSNFNRIQGRLGLTLQHKKLTINLNNNYTTTAQIGSSPSQTNYSGMINLFYSVWGYRPVTQPSVDINSLVDYSTDPGVDMTNDYRFNPILSLNNEYNKRMSTTNTYNGYAEYLIMKGMKLRVSGGYTVQSNRNETFNNSKTRYGSPISTDHVNASLLTSERKTWLNENTLSYQTTINKVHSVSTLAGITFQESDFNSYSLKAINIPNESLGMAGLSQGTPSQNTSLITNWSMVSYLARANYNYKSKYYLTASFRADGSSKFGPDNRFGYFPSASAAWNFTQESFMRPFRRVLQSGKLRLSWGEIGNNRVGEYDTFAQLMILQAASGNYSTINGIGHGVYPFNNVVSTVGAVPTTLGNKTLRWETTTQTNAGLDMTLLKDKITVNVDWYNKETSDLLLQATLPLSSGYATAMKNIGKVQNRGMEFTINTTNIKTKNFKWTSNFNISFNQNKVLELAENQETLMSNGYFDQGYTSPNYIAKIGMPVGMMYGYKYLGTYKTSDFNIIGGTYALKSGVARYVSENNTQPGMPHYADLNNDGVVDANDQTIIGRGDPIHIGGFTNNFDYAGFDLSVFFQWSYGNDILNANRLFFENGMKKKDLNMYASYSDRWTVDNQESDIPRVSSSSSNNLFSTRIIEDGSYLRLKTVSLGYTLNQKVIKKLRISKARCYVSAQNLYTFSKYSGYDPEVSIRNSALTPGLDFSAYPRAATVTVGVNVGF
jgi:TonB-linked SusC/RagA family outer membrane protein